MPHLPTLRTLLGPALHTLRRGVEWAGAITPETRAAARFGGFGPDSLIAWPQATIMGERSIHLGSGTLVGRSCTLSVGYAPDDTELPARGLVIGDRCVLGAGTTLTAHESIVLGDDVWCGQSVFVSDASHGYQDPDTPIGRQLGEHQPVSIGSGSWIGHRAVLLPGTRIGRNVVVGAGSVVRGVVPDHSVVAGVPARVVRRLDPDRGWVGAGEQIRPIWTAEDVARTLASGGASQRSDTPEPGRLR